MHRMPALFILSGGRLDFYLFFYLVMDTDLLLIMRMSSHIEYQVYFFSKVGLLYIWIMDAYRIF